MPLSVGDKLGPYEIVAPIGAGGMGEVWKARDTRLDRIVAIKLLKGRHSARFEQEARAIAALNHPHICQIHDMGTSPEGLGYLVLEYIEGQPLRGPLPVEEAVRLAIQIAGALEEAHRKGILHRDLKPANIVLTAKREPKLLDFGLAKLVDAADEEATKTIEGTVLGTAAYMSPEQAQAQPLDSRSDIFSFGCVLYEMFCGRRAFPGERALTTLGAVIHKDPEPLQASPDIIRIVTRCLRKSAAERYQAVAELRVALETAKVATGTAESPSIAVLPFANMSLDKEQEFFSDGLAEEILNLLAKMPGLKVIARTSSFSFRGKEQDIRKIAEALNVKTVLEGSVRRSGSRIRVTAQLIDASDGSHLWSERYDRELADVFDVQDEIAAAISRALQVKLAPASASETYKPNLPAYEAYLKGRHQLVRWAPAPMARAKEYFEQAISLDPKFALPYSELAGHCATEAFLGLRPALEVMPQIEAWAQKALDVDPSLSDAHAALAGKAFLFDYDWNEAERRFSPALARDPISAATCLYYTYYMVALGRSGEAVERVRRVVEADPLSVSNRVYLAWMLMASGRAEESDREWRQVVELDENYHLGWGLFGLRHFARGDTAEAIHCLEKAYSLAPWDARVVGSLAGLLARTGDIRRAEELLARLGPVETYGVPRAWAAFHLLLGETEKLMDWFEKMIDQRDPAAISMSRNALRSSPRWPALAKRMNLPESAW